MAKGLYNSSHPEGGADSAGTIVDVPGQYLVDAPAPKTIAAMQELGIDVSHYTRQQVTPEMLSAYDKVVVMSEPENTPDWLRDNAKTVLWDVLDTKHLASDGTREIRDEIKRRISEL